MSKTLIIAEKPSVAREIAKVLKAGGGRRDGYIEGNEYIVTWAIGHLVNIAEPEMQNPRWKGRWSLAQLPMIPQRFKLAVLPNTEKQFSIVKSLMQSERVESIINATDAGREGELIFRRIYVQAECDKPIKRLWASDMTEEGLLKAFGKLMSGEDKRNLGLAAFARAEADWLVGMNFSRLFTVKSDGLISVGRVQTPVLKLLADRRVEIENFKPKDYWIIQARFALGEEEVEQNQVADHALLDEPFMAEWFSPPDFKEKRIDEEVRAASIIDKISGQIGVVESVQSRQGTQKPPLPFDLTTLQREANSRFGLSAKDTLSIAQSLYESKKALTYPRTDSRHLTKELFKEILGNFRSIYGHFPEIARKAAEKIKEGKSKFACVNDKKVSDHHAIIPTQRKVRREDLSENEWNIYEMVCRRFCAAFMDNVKFSSSTVWIVVEEEKFKATGKVFKDRGWLSAEPWRASADNPLPKLRKGKKLPVHEAESFKRQTKAPAHFTDATLLGAMETAGKLVEDDELRDAMKERGLGTPATRAQTIETLISRGYVDKKGKKLIASDKGVEIVRAVSFLLPDVASPELTGDWEKKLKDIEAGTFTYPEFMHGIRKFVDDAVNAIRMHPLSAPHPVQQPPHQAGVQPSDSAPEPSNISSEKGKGQQSKTFEPLGPCPSCKGQIVEGERGYGCSNWRPENGGCKFVIWKSQFGGTVTTAAVKDLLSKGRTYRRLQFVSKEGKKFNAFLEMKGTALSLRFND